MLESIKQGISQYVKLSIFIHIPSGRKKLLLHSPWGQITHLGKKSPTTNEG